MIIIYIYIKRQNVFNRVQNNMNNYNLYILLIITYEL